jgi:hypothetical protein
MLSTNVDAIDHGPDPHQTTEDAVVVDAMIEGAGASLARLDRQIGRGSRATDRQYQSEPVESHLHAPSVLGRGPNDNVSRDGWLGSCFDRARGVGQRGLR